MSHRYLDDEELAMLNEVFRQQHAEPPLSLSIHMDAALRPLLSDASTLELTLTLDGIYLIFPLSLDQRQEHAEEARLCVPEIISGGVQERAWRLPSPAGVRLLRDNGLPLAADIADLSVSGMQLVSAHPLFRQQVSRRVLLELNDGQRLPMQLELLRKRRQRGVCISSVQFELAIADRLALSEFVFREFLKSREQERR
ncbi:PilZ domain-containing protein [Oceanimonas sp. NS1]|uniref:PilZ domain-containing protein n=1 Tax=Oceanimonas doudoroffii TaxID=84158 RepID=A0A233RI42_9GAMM|nr:PilZ domain-containing protein [Oceanimonas doudoroffii]MCT7655428.1 PilZ domain-containing protein [Oceanimonas sp. NS1]OXY83061.1 hypothetical protein B6S08_06070 [Oceanimonas doudoroffii]